MSTQTGSLDDLFRTYKIDWYRCPIDRATLREAMRKSDLQGWFQSAGHLVLAACAAGFTLYFFLQEQWIGVLLGLFAYGTVASQFHYGCHELGHGTVFRTRWLNGFFLRVYSVLAWWNFHEYAMSHTYHHLYTLHPARRQGGDAAGRAVAQAALSAAAVHVQRHGRLRHARRAPHHPGHRQDRARRLQRLQHAGLARGALRRQARGPAPGP